ncbi:MAG: GGDEF domain-containing protein [Lachnospiraceae bacterium]|nr:GGDEF domain-containing protein [Lachnospiraceae bacterium]
MEKGNKFKLTGHSFRRIVIMTFCLFVAMCMAFVMFYMYKPNQNALGALSSVCMDIVCIVILFILIGSFAFGNYGSNRTTRLFAVLLVASIWAMFLDFLNWAFDGSLEFGHLTFWFTTGSLCMGSILACIFSIYLYFYMNEMHALGKMKKSAIVCGVLNLISFCLTFILAITGTAFEFVDGHYEIGALYDVVEIIPILSLLYLTGFVICNIKKVGIHDTFAVAGYIFFMVAGALIEAEYNIGSTYVSVAIADIFIFVMIQNEIIAKEKRNVQKWMEKSNTDVLTGFYNRFAYEADIIKLGASVLEDDFVYISADVNSLKHINDSYGHNAGDELLVGAAKCLETCFGSYGKLYRIGGDEFIALINIDENKLETLKNKIDELTSRYNGEFVHGIAISCGYVTKKECENMTIREIAILADHRMYEAKNDYYKRMGIERRKSRG